MQNTLLTGCTDETSRLLDAPPDNQGEMGSKKGLSFNLLDQLVFYGSYHNNGWNQVLADALVSSHRVSSRKACFSCPSLDSVYRDVQLSGSLIMLCYAL